LREEDVGKYRGYSYAILINGNTASAAELLAAVFRDYSLGTLVGEKSFGKGSVQGTYSLERFGLEGGIRVTTKMYFPPSGEGYNGIGIEPDIRVDFPSDKTLGLVDEGEDPQLMRALEVLRTGNK
jgi:carboxyl-terminal processing protease